MERVLGVEPHHGRVEAVSEDQEVQKGLVPLRLPRGQQHHETHRQVQDTQHHLVGDVARLPQESIPKNQRPRERDHEDVQQAERHKVDPQESNLPHFNFLSAPPS